MLSVIIVVFSYCFIPVIDASLGRVYFNIKLNKQKTQISQKQNYFFFQCLKKSQ